MSELFDRPFDRLPSPDELVRATMQWHFDPRTGSPFWLRQAAGLGFDPRRDVNTAADLRRFPDVSDQLRDVPVEELVPLGCRDQEWDFGVYESGGTTGAPKRIIEMRSRRRGVEFVSQMLHAHGIPGEGEGDWLHIGPSGPHIVGRSVGLLAKLRRQFCFYIDFDPRWVKACLRQGRRDEANAYVAHVVEQAMEILRTQNVSVVFSTPPVLEAVCTDPRALALFQRRTRGLIWSGTSMSDESLHLLEEEFFPEARVVGLYGNSMMGIACQRPSLPGDSERCVFEFFHPYCLVDVVDPADPERHVPYGTEGQIRVNLLSREMFLPNNLERDLVLRLPPSKPGGGDCVARVRPLPSHRDVIVEGVY